MNATCNQSEAVNTKDHCKDLRGQNIKKYIDKHI